MLISRKFIKWKVLFCLGVTGVLVVLLHNKSHRHSDLDSFSGDVAENFNLRRNGGSLKNSQKLEGDAQHYEEKSERDTNLSVRTNYSELSNRTKSELLAKVPLPLNSVTKRPILVESVKQNTSNRSVVDNIEKHAEVIQESGSQNLTDVKPPPRKAEYSDCATAKVMPPYTYPEYTAVVSAHGSGNTWARYLIERATGVSTGSYYHDPKLYNGGFLGEMSNPLHRNTIAIKTHHPFQRKDIVFQNAIVIVRDPFDVVLAERNRLVSQNGHTAVVSESYFKGPEWEKFARGHSRYWEHSCRECITIPNYLIVYYSDLKTNLERELRRMLKFLKVEPDEKRIACTLAFPEGKFRRPKKERTFDPFTKELIEEINGHIRNVSELFRINNIAPLPFQEKPLLGVFPT